MKEIVTNIHTNFDLQGQGQAKIIKEKRKIFQRKDGSRFVRINNDGHTTTYDLDDKNQYFTESREVPVVNAADLFKRLLG